MFLSLPDLVVGEIGGSADGIDEGEQQGGRVKGVVQRAGPGHRPRQHHRAAAGLDGVADHRHRGRQQLPGQMVGQATLLHGAVAKDNDGVRRIHHFWAMALVMMMTILYR